jgi:hypothetical protein
LILQITKEDKNRLQSVKILPAISGRKLFFSARIGERTVRRVSERCVCKGQKKAPARRQGLEIAAGMKMSVQPPQEPDPQDPELQPPPPTGLVEVMEKPDRYPASIKSTLMAPQEASRSSSTRKVRSSSVKVLSFSFGSSRARPSEGPAQPPCISAMRTAESMLFCER